MGLFVFMGLMILAAVLAGYGIIQGLLFSLYILIGVPLIFITFIFLGTCIYAIWDAIRG